MISINNFQVRYHIKVILDILAKGHLIHYTLDSIILHASRNAYSVSVEMK